jgi:hypothetical protein
MAFDVTTGTTLSLLLGIMFMLSAASFLGTGVVVFVMSQAPSIKKVRKAVRIKDYRKGWRGKDSITMLDVKTT